jgi:hypothetical protein
MADFWAAIIGIVCALLALTAFVIGGQPSQRGVWSTSKRTPTPTKGRPPGTQAERVERHERHVDELARLRREMPDVQTHVRVDCDGLITSIYITIPATIKSDLTVGGGR